MTYLLQKHHSESKFQPTVPHIVFDYHQECRGGNIGALSKLGARIAQFSKDISIYYVNDNNIQRFVSNLIYINIVIYYANYLFLMKTKF